MIKYDPKNYLTCFRSLFPADGNQKLKRENNRKETNKRGDRESMREEEKGQATKDKEGPGRDVAEGEGRQLSVHNSLVKQLFKGEGRQCKVKTGQGRAKEDYSFLSAVW